jgi:hypothetical protein
VLVLAAGGFLRKEVIAEPLNELRAEYGLQPDPELSMMVRDLVLSPFPASFRETKSPLPARAFSFRLGEITRPKPTSRRPTVYFTLGTVLTPLELYARVLAGLRESPVRVIATLGEHVDPSVFGPQPSDVRIERSFRRTFYCHDAIWSFRTAALAASWERSLTDFRPSLCRLAPTSRITRNGAWTLASRPFLTR